MNKVVVLFVAAIALFAAQSSAQDCTIDGSDADKALMSVQRGRSLECFGRAKDKDPFAVRINKTIATANCKPGSGADNEVLREKLSGAIREINHDLSLRPAPAEWDSQIATLSSELIRAQLSLADANNIAEPTYWQWDDHRTLQGTDGRFRVEYAPLVKNACASGSAACAASAAAAANLTRAVELSAVVNTCASLARIEEFKDKLTAYDEEWNHYFFEARSQFIWELALNSWRFNPPDDEFARPPKDQIILAHPGVAFEYVGGGAHNERAYDAIVMAELIGYNRIRWNDEGKSKLPPLGASVVATYTPDNTGDPTGYGIMFHAYNTLSLGVTRRDTGAGDETTYLLSIDLMKFILNPSPEAMARFRKQQPAAAPSTPGS